LFRRIATLATYALPPARPSVLSQREREILALIRSGMSNKDIARKLTIEVATVKNHVHSLLTKLNVSSRAEASVLDRSAAERPRGFR
jgi:DNA-binding NarL/FixJ family response regulator